MPRASNRVGIEVDAAPPADLLKAKKAERRARARQRAEEKRRKEEEDTAATACSASSEPAKVPPQASEHDQSNAFADHSTGQKPVVKDEDAPAVRRPTACGKLEKLQVPEADEEPVVVTPEKQTTTAGRDGLLDTQQRSMKETLDVGGSNLEEAHAEFGTEEVINVDAYVSRLSTELLQTQTQSHQPSRVSTPAQDLSEPTPPHPRHKTKNKHVQRPTSPDAAAFRIQKALKRKFLKKTLKKCASFLRHSSKVFAEVDFGASSPSRPPSSVSRLPSPAPAATDTMDARDSSLSARLSLALSAELQGDSSTGQHQHHCRASDGDQHAQLKARAKNESDSASVDSEKRREKRATEKELKKRKSCDKSQHGKQTRYRDVSSSSSSSESESEDSKDNAGDSSPETLSSSRSSRSESSFSSASSSASSSSSDQARRRRASSKTKPHKSQPNAPAKKNKSKDSRKTRQDRRSGDESPHDSSTLLGPPVGLLHTMTASNPATAKEDEPVLSTEAQEYDPDAYSYSAVKIQAWLRGVEGRKQALIRRVELEREIESEALFEVYEEASVRIQAIIRGFLLRRQLGIMNKSPASLRKNGNRDNNKAKKKNRRTSITAFFKGDDAQETSSQAQYQRLATDSFEKRAATIEEEVIEQQQTSSSPIRKDSEANVAEWPSEFNLEGLDEWEELNNPANAQGDLVTHAHFLGKRKLRVFCGTWNMHAKKPQDDLRLWIPLNKYHIVAVGSEECVHSIAKSVVFTSKRQWEDVLKETLGEEYVLVSSHSLTAIHNIVFVHESVIPLLSNIQSDAVATGLGNQLGNKGGVGIAFSIGRTSFAFVNCHFDAHQHNTEKRNGNFHRINQELKLYPSQKSAITSSVSPTSSAVTGQSSLDGLGKTTTSRFSVSSASTSAAMQASVGLAGKKLAISECFDRVFWFGDLNYRINGTRRMVDLLLLHNKHDVLRFNDQLQIEMAKGNVFSHFQEGPLHFRPTYKFDKHSNVYDSSSKQRIPSWTDRILFLSNEKAADIEILSYRSQMSFQTSDHRPVGATFQVSFRANEERLTAESSSEFNRVLARGYRPNQAKSEVCVVQ